MCDGERPARLCTSWTITETRLLIAKARLKQMGAHPELRAYLRRSFLKNDPASFEVFDRFVTLLRDRLQEMQKAGLVLEDLDLDWAPFRVLFLHFGPLLLGPAIERALDVDCYAADVIRRRTHATMGLLSRGIFHEPNEAR